MQNRRNRVGTSGFASRFFFRTAGFLRAAVFFREPNFPEQQASYVPGYCVLFRHVKVGTCSVGFFWPFGGQFLGTHFEVFEYTRWEDP